MKSIDEKIREALSQEDAEMVEGLRGERPLREMITETFRSRHRWLHITSFIMPMIFVVAACIFAYRFYYAETTHSMIAWATSAVWTRASPWVKRMANSSPPSRATSVA